MCEILAKIPLLFWPNMSIAPSSMCWKGYLSSSKLILHLCKGSFFHRFLSVLRMFFSLFFFFFLMVGPLVSISVSFITHCFYFSFIPEGYFFLLGLEFLIGSFFLFLFFFRTWRYFAISVWCLWFLTGNLQSFKLLYHPFLAAFKIFFFDSKFQKLIMLCLGVDWFGFTLFGVYLASQMGLPWLLR